LQLVALQPVQSELPDDDTDLPPEEKPKADISLRGEFAPHWGQLISCISKLALTRSSNLFSHWLQANS
jgi:hypothetical protein